ncbi:uncharacterized protein RAG0_00095 [Rhynchosporium agropyri]|uniref:Uncharacterized protein n=1 Tax=Rhynchosporium agropyri TaxID=914238 RepID=A0A1E1JRC2_9HELO|nr:uncharacterized protein RAG0_00095 [Rhynchosporium agropyri]
MTGFRLAPGEAGFLHDGPDRTEAGLILRPQASSRLAWAINKRAVTKCDDSVLSRDISQNIALSQIPK